MAPTEILAKQHYEKFKKMFPDLKVELLVGSVKKKEKQNINEKLESGELDLLIGTHALIQEEVRFKNLGLVITDEQHRFGVNQRNNLRSKGEVPDVLYMSATPIPRTYALTIYGDMDISTIKTLPEGRKDVITILKDETEIKEVLTMIKQELDKEHQIYVVAPLIEDENNDSVTKLLRQYSLAFKNYNIGMLHGKMKPKEKDEIMGQFKDGNIDILISTTVIEVGVNVPNANIMVVENAERFGLAQLHQLRGRVGRGEYKSYCILKYQGNSPTTLERMKVMSQTNDGFIISEKDLELRGSGEFFGTKQHGIPEFKIANLFEDIGILKQVQSLAIKIIEDDNKLEKEKNKLLKKMIENKFEKRIEL